jgi:hypothetical protein
MKNYSTRVHNETISPGSILGNRLALKNDSEIYFATSNQVHQLNVNHFQKFHTPRLNLKKKTKLSNLKNTTYKTI